DCLAAETIIGTDPHSVQRDIPIETVRGVRTTGLFARWGGKLRSLMDAAEAAKIEILIFDLQRPILGCGVFESTTNHPAILCVAHASESVVPITVDLESRFEVSPGQASRQI